MNIGGRFLRKSYLRRRGYLVCTVGTEFVLYSMYTW